MGQQSDSGVKSDTRQAHASNARFVITPSRLARGADLSATAYLAGIEQDQIDTALGDASTRLPDGLERPTGWESDQEVERLEREFGNGLEKFF